MKVSKCCDELYIMRLWVKNQNYGDFLNHTRIKNIVDTETPLNQLIQIEYHIYCARERGDVY